MDTHVKVLGALNVVMGAFGLFAALIVTIVFGGIGIIVGSSGEAEAATAVSILGVIATFVVFCALLLSLPGVIIGLGLWRLRPWARIAGIVLSVLNLLGIPFGTLLGIYGLWVLLNKDTETFFNQTATPSPVPAP
jgi:hypothetical protein